MVEEFQIAKSRVLRIEGEDSLEELRGLIKTTSRGLLVFTDASFNGEDGQRRVGITLVDFDGNLI